MNKVIWLLGFLLLGLSGCYSGKKAVFNYYQMINRKDIVFDYPHSSYSFQVLKFIHTPADTQLIVWEAAESLIKTYDWKTKKVISVNPQRFNYEAFPFYRKKTEDSWCYVNPDSIFLLYNAGSHERFWHDSVFFMMNLKGDSKDVDLGVIPRAATSKKKVSRDSAVYTSMNAAKLEINNGKIFLTFEQAFARPGWANFCKYPYEVGGHIELKDGKHQFIPHPVYFPESMRKNFYPTSFSCPARVINHKGNPVYGFGMTPTYIEYDMKTQKTTRRRVRHSFIDTIHPFPLESNGKPLHGDEQWNNKGGEFFSFFYDPYRYHYIRYLKLPPPKHPTIPELNGRRYGIAIMDSNFKLLGETVLPDELQPYQGSILSTFPRPFIAPDGIYFYNHDQNRLLDKSKIVYSKYEFNSVKEKPKLYPNRDKSFQKDNWNAYLKKYTKIQPVNEAVVVIPLDRCCGSCRDYILKHYQQYRKDNPSIPFYMVVAAEDQLVIDPFLKDSSIKTTDDHIFFDPQSKYLRYALDYVNPKLLLFKNGKLVSSKVYNPAEIPDIIYDVNTHFGIPNKY